MQHYTRFDAQSFYDAMIFNMDSIGKYMLELTLHQQRTPQLLKQKKLMQTQEDHSNLIPALNVDSLKVDLVVIQNTCSDIEDSNSETTSSKSVKEYSLNSETKDVHAIKYKIDDLNGTRIEHGFKREFTSLFGQDADTFTRLEVQHFRDTLLQHLGNVKKSVAGRTRINPKTVMKEGQQQTEQPEFIVEVLGKPVLPSLRNQSVVKQPNAFKYERAQMLKQRFASQVDVNKNLSKPVTQHYLPKKIESAFAKPDHMIASSSSRNSSKNMLRFSSNDMVHNHYLDVAKKKIQERDMNSTTSVSTSARFQSTADGSKPKPRSNNQKSRSLHVSKSTRVTITAVPKSDHSKSSSSFSDSKQFVCSTCHKCVFNANHDACITKLLKEIFTGHGFSPNKTSTVHKKTSPRSDLRWKPTGRFFKYVGLRWIPTGKLFDSCTSKVDSEPPHGSNIDIPNIHKCKQTLDVSACTSINVQKEQSLDLSAGLLGIAKAFHASIPERLIKTGNCGFIWSKRIYRLALKSLVRTPAVG
ncbi:hypothetical protein Tco_0057888 [Tanacetum coccineum]